MGLRRGLASAGFVVAFACAPALGLGQAQGTKTGMDASAGQEIVGATSFGGVGAGTVAAGVAIAAAVAVATIAAKNEDEVPSATAASGTTE